MKITQAVRIVSDDNKVCEILAHTTPAEDKVINAARIRVAAQMNRLGHVEPELLDPDAAGQVTAAADTIQRVWFRLHPVGVPGQPEPAPIAA